VSNNPERGVVLQSVSNSSTHTRTEPIFISEPLVETNEEVSETNSVEHSSATDSVSEQIFTENSDFSDCDCEDSDDEEEEMVYPLEWDAPQHVKNQWTEQREDMGGHSFWEVYAAYRAKNKLGKKMTFFIWDLVGPPSFGDNFLLMDRLEAQAGIFSTAKEYAAVAGELGENIKTANAYFDQMQNVVDQIRRAVKAGDNDNLLEAVVGRLESLLILTYDLSRRRFLSDMIAPILQYIKTWVPNMSFQNKLISLVLRIICEDKHGDIDSDFELQAGWFSDNWQKLSKGYFGKKLAGLICLLTMVGMMPEGLDKENKYVDELFKVIHFKTVSKQSESIFDHLFSSLDWMADSVIPAVSTGDWGLLFSDSDGVELDVMYRNSCDMISKNISGMMEQNFELYGIKSEADMLVYVMKTVEAHAAVKDRTTDKAMQKEMLQRMIRLDKLCNDVQSHWHSHGSREQPFALLFRGPSSVGKTALSNIANHTICQACNFPQGEEYTCTLNGNDKYQSEYRSQHICVIFDDMGNTKPERAESNPLFILIQFINSMHCCALNAEADKKGKNDIRAKVVIATTNTLDLGASYFSVNPASIMRRFSFVVDVTLREECTDVNGSIHPRYAGMTHPDIWDLIVNEIVITRSESDLLADRWDAVPVFKDRLLDIFGFVDLLATTAPRHFARQKAIVEASSDMHKQPHCKKHPMFCCLKDAKGKHMLICARCVKERRGEDDVRKEMQEEKMKLDSVKQKLDVLASPDPVEIDGDGLLPEAGEFTPFPHTEESQQAFLEAYWHPRQLVTEKVVPEDGDPSFVVCKKSYRERIHEIVSLGMTASSDILRKAKDKLKKTSWQTILTTVAAIGGATLGLYYVFRDDTKPEGAVLARIEACARGPNQVLPSDDKYAKVYSNVELDVPQAAATTTLMQLEKKVDRNLHVMTIKDKDGKMLWGNAFPIGRACWMTCAHYFTDGTYTVELRTAPCLGVKRFRATVNQANMWKIPEKDLCVIYMPEGGCTTDFMKYMPMEPVDLADFEQKQIYVYHAFRDMAFGNPEEHRGPSEYKLTTQSKKSADKLVPGVGYQEFMEYEAETHAGMCGSMVFTATRSPALVGVHFAGSSKKKIGAWLPISQSDLNDCPFFKSGIQITEEAPFPMKHLGVDIHVTKDVHPFNPVHYLSDEQVNMNVIGQHDKPLSRFKSDVVESPMLPLLKQELGYEPTHCKPPSGAVRPSRHLHMELGSSNTTHLDPLYLNVAYEDFKAKLQPLVTSEIFREHVHNLSLSEALNGVPGVKGYDPLNPKTSIGWPLNGPKYRFFEEGGEALENGINTHRFVTKRINDNGDLELIYELRFDKEKFDFEGNLEEFLERCVQGKRSYTVFRANLKDEAITFAKAEAKRIRTFAGANAVLVVSARMLTSTLIQMMMTYPTMFETAVGVDAVGKDWGFFREYLTQFGEDRVGETDMPKFDLLAQSPAGLKKAWDLVDWCLAHTDRNVESEKALHAIATECVYPVYEIDGLLVEFLNSGPSGHGMTVIINGLLVSLLYRYAYYQMHGVTELGKIPLFHKQVALLTFGDDAGFNVNREEPKFNQITMAEALETADVAITDAQKLFPTNRFTHIDKMTFLKRGFKFHSALNGYVGPLVKDSIFKSLALTTRPRRNRPESVAQICAGNLAGALTELFYHGEEEYDHYKPLFQKIADQCIDSEGHRVKDFYCPPTKEEIVERYNSTTCRFPEALEMLELQSGQFIEDYREVFMVELSLELQYRAFKQSGRSVLIDRLKNLFSAEAVALTSNERWIPRLCSVQRQTELLQMFPEDVARHINGYLTPVFGIRVYGNNDRPLGYCQDNAQSMDVYMNELLSLERPRFAVDEVAGELKQIDLDYRMNAYQWWFDSHTQRPPPQWYTTFVRLMVKDMFTGQVGKLVHVYCQRFGGRADRLWVDNLQMELMWTRIENNYYEEFSSDGDNSSGEEEDTDDEFLGF
jgi:hypothetical protein